MSPETKEWLSNRVPTFTNLSKAEQDSIYDFTLIWSLFEGEILEGFCNMTKIRAYATKLEDENKLSNIQTTQYLSYLRDRYLDDNTLNDKFAKLNYQKSGSPIEITDALRDGSVTNKIKLIGCLGIVFRLRNNLFHGEKWQYELVEQKSNFDNANNFLKSLMN